MAAHRAPHPLATAARLPDGTIAAFDIAHDRWLWLSPDAARVLDTVLRHGSTDPLVRDLTEHGQDEPRVRAVLEQAEAALTADGLLPAPPGVTPPGAATPAAGLPPHPGRVRGRHHLVAAAGLGVAAVWVKVLPLRRLLALVSAVHRLPPASPQQAAALHAAVLATRPRWWPGRLACLEVAVATLVAVALTGRRVHLVLGARPLPNEAHAWVITPSGDAVGAVDPDRPWTPVHTVPPTRRAHSIE